MKKFEYMGSATINKKIEATYGKYNQPNIDEFLNRLGAEGWEIMPDPKCAGYFAKREITEESSAARKLQ
ncbi:MAG: hypothetical protein K5751_02605 [Treponemataceae bacterium]|nr:hypothetical protein [Treponemataceae bacterium]